MAKNDSWNHIQLVFHVGPLGSAQVVDRQDVADRELGNAPSAS